MLFDVSSLAPVSSNICFKRLPMDRWECNDPEVDDVVQFHEKSIVSANVSDMSDAQLAIYAAFQDFKGRPEYLVGKLSTDDCADNADPVLRYEKLLVGVSFLRGYRRGASHEKILSGVEKCLSWLRSTDFYTAPASTRYHDDVEGGLITHSLKCADAIVRLWECSIFNTLVNLEDAVLCALVHDWCKIGRYEKYVRNVKNEVTGKWEQRSAFRYAEEQIPLGHGEKSAYLARKFFRLSLEEELAIVHHMQKWAADDTYHMDALTQANKVNPLNLMLAFADSVSITNYV